MRLLLHLEPNDGNRIVFNAYREKRFRYEIGGDIDLMLHIFQICVVVPPCMVVVYPYRLGQRSKEYVRIGEVQPRSMSTIAFLEVKVSKY